MKRNREHIERIGAAVVDSCIEVHRELGPGLYESTYQASLARELELRGIGARCEVKLPVIYKGTKVDEGYRLDILVDEFVVIENKAVKELLPIHDAQILAYLKLSGFKLGYLVNWNVPRIKDGIKRFVNGL